MHSKPFADAEFCDDVRLHAVCGLCVQGVGALVLDEFHERSLDADTALALALDCQAWTRPDLRWAVLDQKH